METWEIKQLLQKYFNGETSTEEEKILENYFNNDNVAVELMEYIQYFSGISEISSKKDDDEIENDIMDYILESENRDKIKYFSMWKTVTGIAAAIIIVLGGFLFYQQKQSSLKDSFKNPDEAYEYAQQTLMYVSSKYNKGLAQLSQFEKIEKASEPLIKSFAPINEFFDNINKMETNN